MTQETVSAQDIFTRFTQWQGREPESVAADTTYGNGEFLQWLAGRSTLLTCEPVTRFSRNGRPLDSRYPTRPSEIRRRTSMVAGAPPYSLQRGGFECPRGEL